MGPGKPRVESYAEWARHALLALVCSLFTACGTACGGTCKPGATQCASSTQLQTCGNDGQWGTATACPFACTGVACGGTCAPGNTQCANSTQVQTCGSTGQWGAATTCSSACVGNACGGTCTPAATRCASGTQIQTCGSDGMWAAATPCSFTCVGNTCGGVCTPGATKCANGTQLQTCDSTGQWGAATGCNFACVGTSCGGVCAPGTTQCTSTTQIETCGQCTGSCSPGAVRCNASSKNPEKCGLDGTWGQTATCNIPAQICQPSSGTCVTNNPYNIGNQTIDSSWTNFEPAPNTAYMTNFVPPKTATVTSLRVNGRVTGGACDLYVYSDNGGKPDQRITYEFSVNVVAGFNGATPSVNATLTGGQTYWVGGICSNPSGTVELYQNNTLPSTGYVAVSQPFGTGLPVTFPTGTTRGVTYSFFLQVQDVP